MCACKGHANAFSTAEQKEEEQFFKILLCDRISSVLLLKANKTGHSTVIKWKTALNLFIAPCQKVEFGFSVYQVTVIASTGV